MKRWLGLTCMLAVLLALSGEAYARDSSEELQERLEEANAKLTTLEIHEFSDEAAIEFGQARLEVAEIQGKLTAADYGWAAIVVSRLEARLDLVESVLERAMTEELAEQRETDLGVNADSAMFHGSWSRR